VHFLGVKRRSLFTPNIMPIIRSTEVNQQTAYDVQHWSCCVRLAEKRQIRVHMLSAPNKFVHFCTPDDGHNDARNMLS
jgi:hypothetical protein